MIMIMIIMRIATAPSSCRVPSARPRYDTILITIITTIIIKMPRYNEYNDNFIINISHNNNNNDNDNNSNNNSYNNNSNIFCNISFG